MKKITKRIISRGVALLACLSLTAVAYSQTSKTFTITEGNFHSCVDDPDTATITTLALKGTMNAYDVSALRRFLGNNSNITTLDLSGLTTVNGTYYAWGTTTSGAGYLPGWGLCKLDYVKKVIFGNWIKKISHSSLFFSKALEEVDFKDASSFNTLGFQVFFGCTNLKTINVPSSCATIEARCFDGTAIETFNIPASLSYFELAPWSNCPNLQNFTIEQGNTTFSIVDGCLCNSTGLLLKVAPSGRTTLVIQEGIKGIDTYACFGTHASVIVLPSTITKIGNSAFGGQEGSGETYRNYTAKADFVSLATTCPTFNSDFPNTFGHGYTEASELTFYVPSAALSSYKSNSVIGSCTFVELLDNLSLSEKTDYTPLITKNYTQKITLNKTLTAGVWEGLTLPVSLTNDQIISMFGTGTKIATLTSVDAASGNKINMETTTSGITAGKPFAIQVNEDGSTWTYSGVVATPANVTAQKTVDDESGLAFKGCLESTTVGSNDFILRNGELVKSTTASVSEENPYSSYFTYKSASADKLDLYIDGVKVEPSTGISKTTISKLTNNNIYNIKGQLIRTNSSSVEGLNSGIYVVNGKKVIVK